MIWGYPHFRNPPYISCFLTSDFPHHYCWQPAFPLQAAASGKQPLIQDSRKFDIASDGVNSILPTCSMYGIPSDIYPQHGPTVSEYSIHGSWNIWDRYEKHVENLNENKKNMGFPMCSMSSKFTGGQAIPILTTFGAKKQNMD